MIRPMLAGGAGMPVYAPGPAGAGSQWLFEPKWDGIRAVATIQLGGLALAGRNGNDITAAYPELAPMAAAVAPHQAVLDGEVITFDAAGRPSFERLQRRMHVRNPPGRLMAEVPVVFMAFDLLWLNGQPLLDFPQRERRRALERLDLAGPSWQTSPLLPEAPGPELLEACRAVGLEGYMAKRADASYLAGQRSTAWSKIKAVGRRELVVGGWSSGAGRRAGTIGSLALGCYDGPGGRLLYAGQAGSGLSDALLSRLTGAFATLDRTTSPFAGPTPPGLHFVEPVLVVEVAFNGVTSAGVLRQPSIKGLRTDVAASDVVVDAAFPGPG